MGDAFTSSAAAVPISDKTRKILWGRSGNLCAFCRAHLVIESSELDPAAVVGDECHILSGQPNGPRFDAATPPELIDSIENLLLLCRVHHKLVDDQYETFTAEALHQLKGNHEKWVHDKLSQNTPAPILIARFQSEIPSHLVWVTSAKALLDLSWDCSGRYDDYPANLSDAELGIVGAFLQNLTDWVDLGQMDPMDRISAQLSITENLEQLESSELRVYVARERQQLKGGTASPSDFHVLHLRIVRSDDPTQIKVASEDFPDHEA